MDCGKVGKFISELRKENRLTQKELADKLIITDSAVSKWERGLGFPDVSMLNSLADILGVDVSEILNGEKGHKKKVDVEKAISEALYQVDQKRKERNKKIRKWIIIMTIQALILIIAVIIAVSHYKEYHPDVVVEGENKYDIDKYDISKEGMDVIKEIINKSEKMTNKYNIAYFQAVLDKNGIVKSFTLSLNVFDENEKYIGNAGYTYKGNVLYYNSASDDNLLIAHEYSKNSSVVYISDQIKKFL